MIKQETMDDIKISQRIKQTCDMMKLVAASSCLVIDKNNKVYGDESLLRILQSTMNSIPTSYVSQRLYHHEEHHEHYHLGQYVYQGNVIARYVVGPMTINHLADYENLKLILFNLSKMHDEIEPVFEPIKKNDIPYDIITSHDNYEFMEILDQLIAAFKSNDTSHIESLTKAFFNDYILELQHTNRDYIKYYIMLYYGLLIFMMLEHGYDLNFTGVTIQRFIVKLHGITQAEKLIQYAQSHLNEYLLLGIHEKNHHYSKHMNTLIKHLQENISEHIKIEDMADHLAISQGYLSKLIKKETGKSYTEIYNDIKVEHAKVYLKHTHYNMVEIASRVGYHSQNYFARQFKKKTGLTPLEYRNS